MAGCVDRSKQANTGQLPNDERASCLHEQPAFFCFSMLLGWGAEAPTPEPIQARWRPIPDMAVGPRHR